MARTTLAHETQYVGAQGLDAGLDMSNAGLGHEPQLFPAQVRLHFVEDFIAGLTAQPARETVSRSTPCRGCCRPPQNGSCDISSPARQVRLGRVRATWIGTHRCPVESAERAVMLGAPPAPAAGLDGKPDVAVPRPGKHTHVLCVLEVLVVVRRGQSRLADLSRAREPLP